MIFAALAYIDNHQNKKYSPLQETYMKKKVLIRRACYMIYSLILLFLCTLCIISLALYSRGQISAAQMTSLIILILAIGCVIGMIVYRTLISPYQKHMIKIDNFVHNRKYEDLLHCEYEMYSGERDVWQQFDQILDKQNIIQLSTKHAELLALQNQINPHFLYNTLEAIRGDALSEGMDEIADTTEALSTFFRYTISDTGNLVTLEDELENIENYFKIQKYRFGEKLCLQVDFPEDYAKLLQCKVPKLTLQPIVENAVYHGLESKDTGGLVLISIDSTRSKLLISIQDDGVGLPEFELQKLNERLAQPEEKPAEKKKGSIALTNVSRRIKLLFGEEYGIHLFSIPGVGTDVQVTVPVILETDHINASVHSQTNRQ